MRKTLFLLLLLFLGVSSLPVCSVSAQELRPISLPTKEDLLVTEGMDFCHAGYGLRKTILRLGEEQITELDNGSIENSINFSIGCGWKAFFLDFNLTELSHKTVKPFHFGYTKDDVYYYKKFNIVELVNEALTAGYSIPILKHWIYLNIGIGHAFTRYRFSYIDNNIRYSGEEEMDETWLASGGFSVYLNRYIFFQWKTEESREKNAILYRSQLASLHLFTRF